MGDNLISYLHGKWVSYKTGLPLLCNYWGFHYADSFVLYDREFNKSHPYPEQRIDLDSQYRWPEMTDMPTVFTVPYFPESSWEWHENGGNWCRLFEVDWKDPVFREMALEMIAPRKEVKLSLPPPGVISIAVHARQGGNHEYASPQYDAPLKRPPMSFYHDALLKVVELYPDEPLFVHVFTDAVCPEDIVAEIIEGLPSRVEVSYRKENNSDSLNVVDDFFSLFHYNILIRPESNFSMVPSLLHDYDLLVVPKHAVGVFIDEMEFIRP
ncbi:MAG: hypothetical protein JSR37_02985 [Verrucomicrobia bacterium]|nr:hypothetical protein [Verrucomicrobiota bacterium]